MRKKSRVLKRKELTELYDVLLDPPTQRPMQIEIIREIGGQPADPIPYECPVGTHPWKIPITVKNDDGVEEERRVTVLNLPSQVQTSIVMPGNPLDHTVPGNKFENLEVYENFKKMIMLIVFMAYTAIVITLSGPDGGDISLNFWENSWVFASFVALGMGGLFMYSSKEDKGMDRLILREESWVEDKDANRVHYCIPAHMKLDEQLEIYGTIRVRDSLKKISEHLKAIKESAGAIMGEVRDTSVQNTIEMNFIRNKYAAIIKRFERGDRIEHQRELNKQTAIVWGCITAMLGLLVLGYLATTGVFG